jgi:hypothetical protein
MGTYGDPGQINGKSQVDAEEAYVYGRQGKPDQARRVLNKLQFSDRRQLSDPFVFVGPRIGLGDTRPESQLSRWTRFTTRCATTRASSNWSVASASQNNLI